MGFLHADNSNQRLISREKIAKDLGKRIRKIREDKGISLKEFEAKTNSVAKGNMSAIESGKRFPTLPTLFKIAHHLGISVRDFF